MDIFSDNCFTVPETDMFHSVPVYRFQVCDHIFLYQFDAPSVFTYEKSRRIISLNTAAAAGQLIRASKPDAERLFVTGPLRL